MKAEVKTKFSEGFFLSEQSIKKLEDIIAKRLQTIANFDQAFIVRRNDHATISYSTSSDLIISEENTNIEAVESLSITAEGPTASVRLHFEKGQKTELDIKSDDRDLALLLSADLKEYLKSEVTIKRLAVISRLMNEKIILPISLAIPLIGILIFQMRQSRPFIDYQKATIEEKINYLVVSSQGRDTIQDAPVYLMGGMFVMLLVVSVLGSPKILPSHTFYWGKQASIYDAGKSLRSKIFWGVIVALIVGFAVALFTNKLGLN